MTVCIASPVGALSFEEHDGAVTRLDWGDDGTAPVTELAKTLAQELSQYFAGALAEFSVPLAPRANPFQQRFYEALRAIPYGETRTYGDIAKDLGVSAQSIGQACGANPIPILIPCHRVLGASGLGGFSGRGGVEAKVALLKLEGAAGLLI